MITFTENELKKIKQLISDIGWQATRKDRASDLKRYLLTDLEIIEKKVEELQDLLRETEGVEDGKND